MAETFESLDFIFAGLREYKGSFLMVVIPIREGEAQNPLHYKGKPKRRWAIGGVYQGAEFGDRSAKGLDSASYKERWNDNSAIIGWQALNDRAEAAVRCLKDEADARKRNAIEEAMLPYGLNTLPFNGGGTLPAWKPLRMPSLGLSELQSERPSKNSGRPYVRNLRPLLCGFFVSVLETWCAGILGNNLNAAEPEYALQHHPSPISGQLSEGEHPFAKR